MSIKEDKFSQKERQFDQAICTLSNIFEVLEHLRTHKRTHYADIREECGYIDSTIFNYLDFMRRYLGVEIITKKGPGGYIELVEDKGVAGCLTIETLEFLVNKYQSASEVDKYYYKRAIMEGGGFMHQEIIKRINMFNG